MSLNIKSLTAAVLIPLFLVSCGNKERDEIIRQKQSLDLEKSALEAEKHNLQILRAGFEEQKVNFDLEKSRFEAFKNEENERIAERRKALEADRRASEEVRLNHSQDMAKVILRSELRTLFKDFVSQKTGGFGNAILGLVLNESEQEAFVLDPLMKMISAELLLKTAEETEALAASKKQRQAFIVTVLLKNKENITEALSSHFKQAAAFINSMLPNNAP
jgi:hypothetical protein